MFRNLCGSIFTQKLYVKVLQKKITVSHNMVTIELSSVVSPDMEIRVTETHIFCCCVHLNVNYSHIKPITAVGKN
jgi:hypothetical protein